MLGTFVEVSISGELEKSQLTECSEIAFDQIKRIDETMSFHREESELSTVNRLASKIPTQISSGLSTVLQKAIYFSKLSDGLFDITTASTLVNKGKLPDHGVKFSSDANWKNIELEKNMVFFNKPLVIDLGGIAKGYAVDKAFKAIESSRLNKGGLSKIVVNAGGDLRMWPWEKEKVSIRVPLAPFNNTTDVIMRNGSLATSGPYFGGSIVDKKENIASSESSTSVFSESCIDADALTKIYSISPEFEAAEIEHTALIINSMGVAKWNNDESYNI